MSEQLGQLPPPAPETRRTDPLHPEDGDMGFARGPVGRVPGKSGFASMEAAAEEQLLKNEDAAILESIANSPRVQAENDTAQLEIFGSLPQGTGDYRSGHEGILAADGKEHKGKLQEIRENPRYGKTKAERDRAAKKYRDDIVELTDSGLELSQAKLIMDLREEDQEAKATMIGKLSREMSATAAAKKANALYAKKDAARIKMIREEAIYNRAEYDEDRAFYAPGNTAKTETSPTNEDSADQAQDAQRSPWAAPDADTQVTDSSSESAQWAAPNPEDGQLGNYLDAEGKPVADIGRIVEIINGKIAAGDNVADFDREFDLVANMIRYAGRKEGRSEEEIQKTIDGYVASVIEKIRDRDADRAAEGQTSSSETSETQVTEVVPETVVDRKERKGGPERKTWKKIGGAVLAAAAALGVLGFLAKNHDNDNNDSVARSFVDRSGIDSALSNDGVFGAIPGGFEITDGDWKAIPPPNPEGKGLGDLFDKNGKVNPGDLAGNGADADSSTGLGDLLKGKGNANPDASAEVSDWTWNVAHNLDPGNEVPLMNKAIDAYNKAHGTDFSLVNGRIANSQGRQVNQDEMEDINQLMIDAAPDANELPETR